MDIKTIFFNNCFNKSKLKALIDISFSQSGAHKTLDLLERLKKLGFYYATYAGSSLGLEDLKIPPQKSTMMAQAEYQMQVIETQYQQGEITAVEHFQQVIDLWQRSSENLKEEVINHFRSTDILNPVYMMAFSGARGNMSQVHQLVGMRGLMSDPQGEIISFPIRSNFREGITVTEYVISCFGARKGLVDTALKTAKSGYLTRRLVDVSQEFLVSMFECGTQQGLPLMELKEGAKTLYSLEDRLIGRVLWETLVLEELPNKVTIQSKKFNQPLINCQFPNTNLPQNKNLQPVNLSNPTLPVANSMHITTTRKKPRKSINSNIQPYVRILKRNLQISASLAEKIAKIRSGQHVIVRSPLTCNLRNSVCQLCYGWSLSQQGLVNLGEAVGIIAAQSIGEPGTQLTMRTFHTGGVFSGDILEGLQAPSSGYVYYKTPIPGTVIRTVQGKPAYKTRDSGTLRLLISNQLKSNQIALSFSDYRNKKQFLTEFDDKACPPVEFYIPMGSILIVKQGEFVSEKQLLAELPRNLGLSLKKQPASNMVKTEKDKLLINQSFINQNLNLSEQLSETKIIVAHQLVSPIEGDVYIKGGGHKYARCTNVPNKSNIYKQKLLKGELKIDLTVQNKLYTGYKFIDMHLSAFAIKVEIFNQFLIKKIFKKLDSNLDQLQEIFIPQSYKLGSAYLFKYWYPTKIKARAFTTLLVNKLAEDTPNQIDRYKFDKQKFINTNFLTNRTLLKRGEFLNTISSHDKVVNKFIKQNKVDLQSRPNLPLYEYVTTLKNFWLLSAKRLCFTTFRGASLHQHFYKKYQLVHLNKVACFSTSTKLTKPQRFSCFNTAAIKNKSSIYKKKIKHQEKSNQEQTLEALSLKIQVSNNRNRHTKIGMSKNLNATLNFFLDKYTPLSHNSGYFFDYGWFSIQRKVVLNQKHNLNTYVLSNKHNVLNKTLINQKSTWSMNLPDKFINMNLHKYKNNLTKNQFRIQTQPIFQQPLMGFTYKSIYYSSSGYLIDPAFDILNSRVGHKRFLDLSSNKKAVSLISQSTDFFLLSNSLNQLFPTIGNTKQNFHLIYFINRLKKKSNYLKGYRLNEQLESSGWTLNHSLYLNKILTLHPCNNFKTATCIAAKFEQNYHKPFKNVGRINTNISKHGLINTKTGLGISFWLKEEHYQITNPNLYKFWVSNLDLLLQHQKIIHKHKLKIFSKRLISKFKFMNLPATKEAGSKKLMNLRQQIKKPLFRTVSIFPPFSQTLSYPQPYLKSGAPKIKIGLMQFNLKMPQIYEFLNKKGNYEMTTKTRLLKPLIIKTHIKKNQHQIYRDKFIYMNLQQKSKFLHIAKQYVKKTRQDRGDLIDYSGHPIKNINSATSKCLTDVSKFVKQKIVNKNQILLELPKLKNKKYTCRPYNRFNLKLESFLKLVSIQTPKYEFGLLKDAYLGTKNPWGRYFTGQIHGYGFSSEAKKLINKRVWDPKPPSSEISPAKPLNRYHKFVYTNLPQLKFQYSISRLAYKLKSRFCLYKLPNKFKDISEQSHVFKKQFLKYPRYSQNNKAQNDKSSLDYPVRKIFLLNPYLIYNSSICYDFTTYIMGQTPSSLKCHFKGIKYKVEIDQIVILKACSLLYRANKITKFVYINLLSKERPVLKRNSYTNLLRYPIKHLKLQYGTFQPFLNQNHNKPLQIVGKGCFASPAVEASFLPQLSLNQKFEFTNLYLQVYNINLRHQLPQINNYEFVWGKKLVSPAKQFLVCLKRDITKQLVQQSYKSGQLPIKKIKMELGIKSGWIYIPNNFKSVTKNNQIVYRPSHQIIDDIYFDNYLVKIECIAFKKSRSRPSKSPMCNRTRVIQSKYIDSSFTNSFGGKSINKNIQEDIYSRAHYLPKYLFQIRKFLWQESMQIKQFASFFDNKKQHLYKYKTILPINQQSVLFKYIQRIGSFASFKIKSKKAKLLFIKKRSAISIFKSKFIITFNYQLVKLKQHLVKNKNYLISNQLNKLKLESKNIYSKHNSVLYLHGLHSVFALLWLTFCYLKFSSDQGYTSRISLPTINPNLLFNFITNLNSRANFSIISSTKNKQQLEQKKYKAKNFIMFGSLFFISNKKITSTNNVEFMPMTKALMFRYGLEISTKISNIYNSHRLDRNEHKVYSQAPCCKYTNFKLINMNPYISELRGVASWELGVSGFRNQEDLFTRLPSGSLVPGYKSLIHLVDESPRQLPLANSYMNLRLKNILVHRTSNSTNFETNIGWINRSYKSLVNKRQLLVVGVGLGLQSVQQISNLVNYGFQNDPYLVLFRPTLEISANPNAFNLKADTTQVGYTNTTLLSSFKAPYIPIDIRAIKKTSKPSCLVNRRVFLINQRFMNQIRSYEKTLSRYFVNRKQIKNFLMQKFVKQNSAIKERLERNQSLQDLQTFNTSFIKHNSCESLHINCSNFKAGVLPISDKISTFNKQAQAVFNLSRITQCNILNKQNIPEDNLEKIISNKINKELSCKLASRISSIFNFKNSKFINMNLTVKKALLSIKTKQEIPTWSINFPATNSDFMDFRQPYIYEAAYTQRFMPLTDRLGFSQAFRSRATQILDYKAKQIHKYEVGRFINMKGITNKKFDALQIPISKYGVDYKALCFKMSENSTLFNMNNKWTFKKHLPLIKLGFQFAIQKQYPFTTNTIHTNFGIYESYKNNSPLKDITCFAINDNSKSINLNSLKIKSLNSHSRQVGLGDYKRGNTLPKQRVRSQIIRQNTLFPIPYFNLSFSQQIFLDSFVEHTPNLMFRHKFIGDRFQMRSKRTITRSSEIFTPYSGEIVFSKFNALEKPILNTCWFDRKVTLFTKINNALTKISADGQIHLDEFSQNKQVASNNKPKMYTSEKQLSVKHTKQSQQNPDLLEANKLKKDFNKHLLLTEWDQITVSTKSDSLFENAYIGKFMRSGEQIAKNTGEIHNYEPSSSFPAKHPKPPICIPDSVGGQLIGLEINSIILRKSQCFASTSAGKIHVNHGQRVGKQTALATLFYEKRQTEDIVQGIPKIEQLFEARSSSNYTTSYSESNLENRSTSERNNSTFIDSQTKQGLGYNTSLVAKSSSLTSSVDDSQKSPQQQLSNFFQQYLQTYTPEQALAKSYEKIRLLIIDSIQRVYLSQGVLISDKHLEIIVRRMTSTVRVFDFNPLLKSKTNKKSQPFIKGQIASKIFGSNLLGSKTKLNQIPAVSKTYKVSTETSVTSLPSFSESQTKLRDTTFFPFEMELSLAISRQLSVPSNFLISHYTTVYTTNTIKLLNIKANTLPLYDLGFNKIKSKPNRTYPYMKSLSLSKFKNFHSTFNKARQATKQNLKVSEYQLFDLQSLNSAKFIGLQPNIENFYCWPQNKLQFINKPELIHKATYFGTETQKSLIYKPLRKQKCLQTFIEATEKSRFIQATRFYKPLLISELFKSPQNPVSFNSQTEVGLLLCQTKLVFQTAFVREIHRPGESKIYNKPYLSNKSYNTYQTEYSKTGRKIEEALLKQVLIPSVIYWPRLRGITRASLNTESVLSAVSFQETTRGLSIAAFSRKRDFLRGIKERVIVGELIPTGTGYFATTENSGSGKSITYYLGPTNLENRLALLNWRLQLVLKKLPWKHGNQ
uniref:DNA-directed RNA polymerase n=1 Tax=Pleurastrum terricola TaxID=34116 RepID=A6YGE2_PLETE|nr:beta'' subunit of RNA polymerase [Pleurastrum terricola]ABO69354.1 beta'' subunit of RNA polymerase [Pleurastrum terricola]